MADIMKKYTGFTLAEVLITLGIIGVVAALTLPALVQKNQEKSNIVRLKKVYSILSQAYLFAVEEYGTPDLWNLKGKAEIKDDDGNIIGYDSSGIEIQRKYLTKFMKGKSCEKIEKCLPAAKNTYMFNLSQKNQSSGSSGLWEIPVFVLPDNTFIQFTNIVSENCTSVDVNRAEVCSHIEVFLPSGAKEYRRGVNNFMFYLSRNGIIPAGRENSRLYSFERFCKNDKSNTDPQNGHGCTAWVIYNENMDYLHCADLSWSGKNKCR